MSIFRVLHCCFVSVTAPESLEHCIEEEVRPFQPDILLDKEESLFYMSASSSQREHSGFWLTQLEVSALVEDILLEGYRLPFLAYPPPMFMLNHHSARRELEFVDAEIDSLVV